MRKKLHNEVEDLRGGIRVFARVRPLNSREKALVQQGKAEDVSTCWCHLLVAKVVFVFVEPLSFVLVLCLLLKSGWLFVLCVPGCRVPG